MSFKELTLQPILSRKQSPYVVMSLPQQSPAVDLKIFAGHNRDVPNHWELTFLVVGYIASAAVANRYLETYIYNKQGNVNLMSADSFRTDNITASQSKYMIFRRTQNHSGGTDDGAFVQEMLPESWRMSGDDYLVLFAFSEQAGDLWQVSTVWKWKNWDLGMEYPDTGVYTPPAEKKSCWLF